MALTLANATAFAPLMDADALIRARGAQDAAAVSAKVCVSAPDPYAENVGGAARAERWAVVAEASALSGGPLPERGAIITFPSRPDLPRLFVQRARLLGCLVHLECTSSERAAQ